jgi:hypothetical protein
LTEVHLHLDARPGDDSVACITAVEKEVVLTWTLISCCEKGHKASLLKSKIGH